MRRTWGPTNLLRIRPLPGKTARQPLPVLDLVICHGDFLNANNSYEHKNKSFRGLGSYGDILVRDRKMYVAPTPFALLEGAANHRTLVLPKHVPVDGDFVKIDTLTRYYIDSMIVNYKFDLQSNELETGIAPNPNAGEIRIFNAYRLVGDSVSPIRLVDSPPERAKLEISQDRRNVNAPPQ